MRSLAARLTRDMLMAVGALWLITALGVAWYLRSEITEGFDSALLQSAYKLLDLVDHELDEKEHHPDNAMNLRMAAQKELARLGHDDVFLIFQIVDDQQRLLRRSVDSPTKVLDVPLQTGFYDTPQLRVFTLKHPLEPVYIHVADPLEHRRHALLQTTLRLLLPLLAILPLLAWVTREVTQRALVSVARVARQIQQRSGHDLSPVDDDGLPIELQAITASTNHLLERLSHALDTERALAANAAHELRTPLAATRLRLQTLLELETLPGGAREQLQQALQSLNSLSRRAEKLLQLSRAESGAALAQAPVNLGLIAGAVAQEFWADPAQLSRLHLDLPTQQDVWVRGDADAIAIALRNLVENALRHAPGARVDIQVLAPATLRVSDQGPGVPQDQLLRLRERHARQSSDRTGFGLGLSIIQSIAERHQAEFVLRSPGPDHPHGLEASLHFQVSP